MMECITQPFFRVIAIVPILNYPMPNLGARALIPSLQASSKIFARLRAFVLLTIPGKAHSIIDSSCSSLNPHGVLSGESLPINMYCS